MTKRFLQFEHAEHGIERRIEVTGKSERQIERIERGMLINCNVDGGWFVNDVTEEK